MWNTPARWKGRRERPPKRRIRPWPFRCSRGKSWWPRGGLTLDGTVRSAGVRGKSFERMRRASGASRKHGAAPNGADPGVWRRGPDGRGRASPVAAFPFQRGRRSAFVLKNRLCAEEPCKASRFQLGEETFRARRGQGRASPFPGAVEKRQAVPFLSVLLSHWLLGGVTLRGAAGERGFYPAWLRGRFRTKEKRSFGPGGEAVGKGLPGADALGKARFALVPAAVFSTRGERPGRCGGLHPWTCCFPHARRKAIGPTRKPS